MRIMGWILLVLGLYFLAQGFAMPLIAERSDVESSEFMQIREASSHLGIGLMIGAVACALLDQRRDPATTQRPGLSVPPQYPPQQPYQQPGNWQAPPQH
ncbi:hypothetical protein ACIBLA_17020 [Streptomyces sp. NPDC050433]|uniref:hypothetical protein n=1 Tax=unclassified Streptomyces TaxID=2593676 RepID=UPI00341682BB